MTTSDEQVLGSETAPPSANTWIERNMMLIPEASQPLLQAPVHRRAPRHFHYEAITIKDGWRGRWTDDRLLSLHKVLGPAGYRDAMGSALEDEHEQRAT